MALQSLDSRGPLLPRQAVIGNFNNWKKFDPDTVALWARVMRRLPHSVLWLLATLPYAGIVPTTALTNVFSPRPLALGHSSLCWYTKLICANVCVCTCVCVCVCVCALLILYTLLSFTLARARSHFLSLSLSLARSHSHAHTHSLSHTHTDAGAKEGIETVLRQHSVNTTRLIVTSMLPKERHLVSKRQVQRHVSCVCQVLCKETYYSVKRDLLVQRHVSCVRSFACAGANSSLASIQPSRNMPRPLCSPPPRLPPLRTHCVRSRVAPRDA